MVGISSKPSNLDPRFALDAPSQRICQLLFDGLILLDNHLRISPHLATKWDIKNDKLYRFYLRKDAKFPDGTPITAQDLATTLNQILDPNFGSPLKAGFSNIESVATPDPHTLDIALKEPQASFLTDLTLVKALPHRTQDTSEKAFKKHLMGSGPYKMVSQTQNKIVLEKNPTYFGAQPKFKKIIFKVVKEDSTKLLKLKKGELDLIQNDLNADTLLQLKNEANLSLTQSPGISYSYLGMNLKDPILKNLKVRKAIAHALNRQEIIQHLFHGLVSPAQSLLSPLNWYFEKNVQTYEYAPHTAKTLLKQTKLALPIKLSFKTSTDEQSVNVARIIADQLRAVGFEVELQTNEWGTFFRDIKNGNSQLFSLRWVGITDPDIYYTAFHTDQFAPEGRNRVFYSNSKMDKWLEEGRTTLSDDKRKKIYSKIQKQTNQDLPYIHLWHYDNVAIYTTRLRGFYFHPQANFTPFMEMWKE